MVSLCIDVKMFSLAFDCVHCGSFHWHFMSRSMLNSQKIFQEQLGTGHSVLLLSPSPLGHGVLKELHFTSLITVYYHKILLMTVKWSSSQSYRLILQCFSEPKIIIMI